MAPVKGTMTAVAARAPCCGRAPRERNLDSADFDALEEQARGKLSPAAYAFAAAGADDEITVAENIAAWRRLRLRPRMLNDITAIDIGVSVLGTRLETPIMVAPFGRHKLFHPEGERATARGAAAAGAVFVLPTTSTVSMEDVATEPSVAPRWFQLYLPPDRALAEHLIDRAAAAGFRAIVLTVDQPVYGSSPRAARAPLAPSPDIRNANLPGQPIAQNAYKPDYSGKVAFPTTWHDLEWLVRRSSLDVLVKGVLRGDDARRCVEAGVKAIIVSNHGGRHLDGTLATAEALPEIATAVAGQAELYVDGGIRRGTDIVKALALGAHAVLVARPVIWGLALNGSAGVRAVLDHLRGELVRSMALCGVTRLDDITGDLVAGI
jgi:4-hydroxymandelate oxidase